MHFILEISTKHVFRPQINPPMHGDQSIWRKVQKFVSGFEVILQTLLTVLMHQNFKIPNIILVRTICVRTSTLTLIFPPELVSKRALPCLKVIITLDIYFSMKVLLNFL